MNTDIDGIMRKTRQYWYEDGLSELLGGLFFLAVGLLLLADWATPAGARWKWLWTPSFMILTIVAILLGRPVINRLKERITYPRTGYVAYRHPPRAVRTRRAVLAGSVGAVVSLALVAVMAYRQEFGRVAPLLLGFGVALLLMRFGAYTGLPRFFVLAAWSLTSGMALALLSPSMSFTIGLYYALLGLALGIAGGYTLRRYLTAGLQPSSEPSSAPEVEHDA